MLLIFKSNKMHKITKKQNYIYIYISKTVCKNISMIWSFWLELVLNCMECLNEFERRDSYI